MSHFLAYVLLPKTEMFNPREEAKNYKETGALSAAAEAVLEDMLAPYDENERVDEYEEKCWCVRMDERKVVANVMGQLFNITAEERRDEGERELDYRAVLGKRLRDLGYKAGFVVEDEEMEKANKVYDEFDGALDRITRAIMEDGRNVHGNPDPDCEECNGTGIAKSTYNPDSKWDWWQVGGRWAGEEGADVSVLSGKETSIPYAIITPDGMFHSRGDMGWFGSQSNSKEDWDVMAKLLMERHKGCLLVKVDMHI